MADPAKAIEAITKSRPPATDRFTYLTIIETNLCPEILPTLQETLQDAELCQEIGWDLVYNLVSLPGSGACLETIARVGNPREVILKVLETLELLQQDEGYPSDDERGRLSVASVSKNEAFITLLGMLAILHRRIKTKYPSRFLAQTLQTVIRAYQPNQERTASVINLVHSLSGQRRPPLPSRKSSVSVANPDQDSDASKKNGPDPEDDKDGRDDPKEMDRQERLLLSFVTCVLEAYINGNDPAWAPRLLEFYNPERLVPRRRTLMSAFNQDKELLERDAIVGQLAALTKDLGLQTSPDEFVTQILEEPWQTEALDGCQDAEEAGDIPLSTGGIVCLIAYWTFSSTAFDAYQPRPDLYIFPEHFGLLRKSLEDEAESRIIQAHGPVQAIITLGLWLQANNLMTRIPSEAEDATPDFMKYLHLLALVAVFHPQLHVRDAASVLAGLVLHADPSDHDRLRILYDLLENCVFARLKACALTWLREEIMMASQSAAKDASPTVFAGISALETLQYAIFPPADPPLAQLDNVALIEHLVQNSPFLLQAINFGIFLWSMPDRWAHVLPANMEATVKERWLVPLKEALDRLGGSEELEGEELGPLRFELDILGERLERLARTEGFKPVVDASAG